MTQQPAEAHANDALDGGNREDRPWVLSEDSGLILHEPHTCALCDRHLEHYRETGIGPSSDSFLEACRADEMKIVAPMSSTYNELKELCDGWKVTVDDLKKEIKAAVNELEAIQKETGENSREIGRVMQELKEVREETASFRREGAGLYEASRCTSRDPLSSQSRPPRRRKNTGHTRTPDAQPTEMDTDSDVQIISPPS